MASGTIPRARVYAHDTLYAPSTHTPIVLNTAITLNASAQDYTYLEVGFTAGTAATMSGLMVSSGGSTGSRNYAVSIGGAPGYVKMSVNGTQLTVTETNLSNLCLYRVFGVS